MIYFELPRKKKVNKESVKLYPEWASGCDSVQLADGSASLQLLTFTIVDVRRLGAVDVTSDRVTARLLNGQKVARINAVVFRVIGADAVVDQSHEFSRRIRFLDDGTELRRFSV